jgi:hypothetical protein
MGVVGAGNVMAAVRGTPNEGMGVAAMHEAADQQAQAEAALTQTYNTPGSEVYDVGAQSSEAGTRESKQLFDAIRLSFDVTSEKDLTQPYYAVIAQIRERDSKPGQVRKWAYVKSLGPMQAGVPKSVSAFQAGLPPGYILEDYEVHLYNQGEELATNLSRKRVPLTDDEALEFQIIEYVAANKGRSLPAAPLGPTLSGRIRATGPAAQSGEVCYVRVARDGRVTAAYRDPDGKQPLADPALEAALRAVRFQPALEAGKPVESVVAVNLGPPASP